MIYVIILQVIILITTWCHYINKIFTLDKQQQLQVAANSSFIKVGLKFKKMFCQKVKLFFKTPFVEIKPFISGIYISIEQNIGIDVILSHMLCELLVTYTRTMLHALEMQKVKAVFLIASTTPFVGMCGENYRIRQNTCPASTPDLWYIYMLSTWVSNW